MSDTPSETRGFSLVVLGSMNPALHHPAWYRAAAVLNDEEADSALANEFVFLPQLAQFRTSGIQIFCDPQRWQIIVDDAARIERGLDIVELVFDKRLHETPIRSFGLNFSNHLRTQSENVGRTIGDLIATLPFQFMSGADAIGKLSFSTRVPDGTLRCEIDKSSQGSDLVYITFNAHYELRDEFDTAKNPIAFALRPLIDRHLKEIRQEVQTRTETIIRVVSEHGAR